MRSSFTQLFDWARHAVTGICLFGPFSALLYNVTPVYFGEYFSGTSFFVVMVLSLSRAYEVANTNVEDDKIFTATGLAYACLSIICVFLFMYEISNWTVTGPGADNIGYQVGFGVADWSLTEAGRSIKNSFHDATPYTMIDGMAAFSPTEITKIWTPLSISLAGSLTWVTYFVSVFLAMFSAPFAPFVYFFRWVRRVRRAKEPFGK